MSRHISSVLSWSMFCVAGFDFSVHSSGGCLRGGETRFGGEEEPDARDALETEPIGVAGGDEVVTILESPW
jgi:hypothetical protein